MDEKFWVGARLLIFFISVFYIASSDESVRNFDNFDATLIAVVSFFASSAWLFLHRRRMGAGLDTSISFTGPFWPIRYHPFQFLTLASVISICGGIANISAVFVSGHGSDTTGFVFFFMGVAFALVIGVHRYFTRTLG
jgi:hypothetical protein